MSFKSFQSLASSRLRFGFFMLVQLPAAFFSGVRLRSINENEAVVSVPYKWFSQNPFRSTYFACQAMAAEMSTGVLALGHLYKRKPAVSMLVTGLKATFYKKATENTYFTCDAGLEMLRAIEQAIDTGTSQVVEVKSTGRNKEGQVISEFTIEWSFKRKNLS
jgi:acyl-coenzyme A thioesterase PaaI-like protein